MTVRDEHEVRWNRLRRACLLWCGLVVLRFLFHYELQDRLWVMLVPLDAILLVAAAVNAIGCARLWWAVRSSRREPVLLCVVATVALLGWATPLGRLSGACFRLWRHEAGYRTHVQEILAGAPRTLEANDVEAGPPTRVVFSWGGIVDNWVGIVFDPSRQVTNLETSRLWFGGVIVTVTHLWRDWYLCSFT